VPEGDTVYRVARILDAALAGRVLDRCDIRVPAFATVDLTGERVESVVSIGKHLLHRIGEFTIHSHLKMEGSWEVYPTDARWRHPAWQARAILGVPGTVAVGFQLGELDVVPREREGDLVGYLGPDILGVNWGDRAAVAVQNFGADPTRAIGLALLDQRVVAGLGNVYRNELCFLRGILPTRPVRDVSDPAGLLGLAHRVITANRDRVERSTTGDLRRGRRTWVHGREHDPCRRCGTPIRQGLLGDTELTERQTFYCPSCQN
jgi:endonuclease-8